MTRVIQDANSCAGSLMLGNWAVTSHHHLKWCSKKRKPHSKGT